MPSLLAPLRRLLRFNLPVRRVFLALAIVLAVRAPFVGADVGWWLAALASYYFVITVGFSVGMHRYFCHRAFTTSRLWEGVMLGTLVVSLAGVPYTWTRAHLTHHKNSDQPDDPYRVKTAGWRSIFLPYDPQLSPKYVMRWLRDPLQNAANAGYHAWVLGYLALLWCVGGWHAVTFVWAIPTAVIHPLRQFYFHYSVHTWGYRNFDTNDDSRNNWWIAVLTGGEGWHNNHHQDPRAWSYRVKWWELDPGAWFIALVRRSSDQPAEAEASPAVRG
ncbi:MAG: acyl-CoA desaturase [Planctomycetes bacterium]|nr:acyl-CoA desaturase [Planctomycetota bacterium]